MGAHVPDRGGAPPGAPRLVALYNEQWLVERHGFRSPRQVRRDLLVTSEAA